MPADERYDTPHERTVKHGRREPCWNNRSFRERGYWVQDGWEFAAFDCDGVPHLSKPKWVWVVDAMSQECGQKAGLAPAGCDGCKEMRE